MRQQALRRIRVIGLGSLTLGALILAFTMHVANVRAYHEQLLFVSEGIGRRPSIPGGEITGVASFGQSFRATRPSLTEVRVYLSNYRKPNRFPIVLQVSDAKTGEVLRTSTARPGTIQDNRYHSFPFPIIRTSQGRSFLLTLRSPESKPGEAVTAWLNDQDPYPHGSAFVNGAKHPEFDLVATVRYQSPNGVVIELVNRMSQYKPEFFKGFGLKMLALVVLAMTMVTGGTVIASVLGGREARSRALDPPARTPADT